jgi:lipopolysaccharide/colanic/teichoic acid biosynthesis glycosyltransferase
MEPNILATPESSLPGSPDRKAVSAEAVHAIPGGATGGVSTTLQNGHANGTAHPAVNGHANGHANGVAHANGHSNGHANGHANGVAAAIALASTSAHPYTLEIAPEPGLYLRFGKRAIDVLGACAMLVVTAPVLALAALLIKLESRGPVLYKSQRVGRGGRMFTFFKLRSMVNGADRHRHHLSHLNETDGPVFKMARDPRVTRVGRFLRTTSIDELPQLINVLRGEMSLVGPRPPILEEVAQYEPWQLRRLDVRPGITCLWQISGRSRIGFQEWMRLDLEYIRRQSLPLDLKILVRTLPAVLSREGAY